jgi:DNA mismatch repair protein MutL
VTDLFERLLESLKTSKDDPKVKPAQRLARTLSRNLSVQRNRKLQQEEIASLIEQLFSCKVPDITPDGKPTLTILEFDELKKKFK